MFNLRNVEQRINPVPFEYFEYETIIKKGSKLDIKLSNIISKIIFISIKCTKNLAFFFGNCLFFSLNKTRFYMLLKAKDFSDGRASLLGFPVIIAMFFFEMQVKKINNGKYVNFFLFNLSKKISKLLILDLVYKKEYSTFFKKYCIVLNRKNQLLLSPVRIIGQISIIVFSSLIVNFRIKFRLFDVSYSIFETTAFIFKVYKALEECKALYKKNPKQSLINSAYYTLSLGLSLLRLYNTINYKPKPYTPPTLFNCGRVDSLSDKLEERIMDDKLKPQCLEHQAQLINPKYKFKIIEEKFIDEPLEASELIKKISPLNFTVSELRKECKKFALSYHPDTSQSPDAEKISQRILDACKLIKNGIRRLPKNFADS